MTTATRIELIAFASPASTPTIDITVHATGPNVGSPIDHHHPCAATTSVARWSAAGTAGCRTAWPGYFRPIENLSESPPEKRVRDAEASLPPAAVDATPRR